MPASRLTADSTTAFTFGGASFARYTAVKAVASEMAYSSGLQRQALFSIALVLYLFVLLLNAALNFFLKRKKEG